MRAERLVRAFSQLVLGVVIGLSQITAALAEDTSMCPVMPIAIAADQLGGMVIGDKLERLPWVKIMRISAG